MDAEEAQLSQQGFASLPGPRPAGWESVSASFPRPVTWSKSHNPSVPRFPHLEKGEVRAPTSQGYCEYEVRGMMTVMLAQGLMQRWCVKAGDEGDKDEEDVDDKR